MTFCFSPFRTLPFLTLALPLLLAAPIARAQRAGDGPPANDPFGRRRVAAREVPGGRYRSHSYDGRHLRIQATDGSTIQLRTWAPGVVKVDYFAPSRSLRADSSVSVVQAAAAPAAGAIQATAATVRIPITGNLWVAVQKSPLRVSILQGTDTLMAEAASAFRREATAPAPAIKAEPGGTAVKFRLQPGEQLYGTGSRALPLDRRGYRLELYNQAHYASQNGEPNLNIALPVVLSSRGYLLLFDHHTAGYLDLGKTDPNVLEYGGEELTSLSYFVVTGKSQAEILNRYTALTGRQPLPPRWALGLIQSRFGYKTDAEMLNVAARMRREGFPLDALVLDLFWFGGTKQQGDLEWYQPNFPDPAGMMRRLKEQGVNTILISEPYVMRSSRNDSLVRTQELVGTTAAGRPYTVASFWAGPASIVDVFKPSAREWLWSYYRKLHNQGAAGWWSDLGEPENHPEAMRHAWGPTRQVHNAYGQLWAGIFRDNYAREFPDERLFNLARSGWAGMQRNAVFPWSGDINRSWSGFQAQVPVMLGMGVGGVGYMHSDAGGFCVGSIDSELYTRWLQMASLCPIMRPHGEGVPPEPYYYPEPYKSAVRNAAHLRYELLPYLYTLAWQNTTTGAPLARMMNYDTSFNEELRMRNEELSSGNSSFLIPHSSFQNTQYLLGPNLLVAPVLQPGQRRRNVELPAGSWIDFYSNQTLSGGRTVSVPAPLARTPLLVKAGAFLPMANYRPSTSLYRPDTLLLRYYPDPRVSESEFTMYDDDGHSAQALARQQYETLTMRGFYGRQQTDVVLSSDGGYPAQPVFRLLRLLVQRVAAPPAQVLLDGQPAPAEAWTYDAARRELEIHFLMNAGTAVSIRGLQLSTRPAPGLEPDALTLEAPDSRSFGPGGTTLRYTRHAAGEPTPLRIRDARGALVRTLALEGPAGAHQLKWDARSAQGQPLPAGVYTAEAAGQHQRLILTQ
jgi:oligosaccharide 4-alpha-D-glucosyltransferase